MIHIPLILAEYTGGNCNVEYFGLLLIGLLLLAAILKVKDLIGNDGGQQWEVLIDEKKSRERIHQIHRMLQDEGIRSKIDINKSATQALLGGSKSIGLHLLVLQDDLERAEQFVKDFEQPHPSKREEKQV